MFYFALTWNFAMFLGLIFLFKTGKIEHSLDKGYLQFENFEGNCNGKKIERKVEVKKKREK